MDNKQFKNYPQDFKGLKALFVAENMRQTLHFERLESRKEQSDHLGRLWDVANSPKIRRILERLGAVDGERVNFATLGALCKAYATTQRVLCFGGVDIYKDTLKAICKWCAHCMSWGAYKKNIEGNFGRELFETSSGLGSFFDYFGIYTPQELDRLGEAFIDVARCPGINTLYKKLEHKPKPYQVYGLLAYSWTQGRGAHA